ncbi:hypothetical protein ABIE89_006489 [Bradyrhizobium niftali]
MNSEGAAPRSGEAAMERLYLGITVTGTYALVTVLLVWVFLR